MKTPTIVVFFISFVWGFLSLAQSLYIPPYCEGNQMDLQVRNLASQSTNYWLGWMNEQGASDEISMEVAGGENSAQDLSAISKTSSFKIYRPMNSTLSLKVRCHDSEALLPLTTRISPLQEYKLDSATADLKISNLSWNENPIQLEWFDSKGEKLQNQSFSLPAKGNQQLQLQNPANARTLKIQAEYRILSAQSQKTAASFQIKNLKAPAAKDGAYFEMGLRNNSQAPKFIVYIDDPALLDEARRLIKNPQIEKIVFGKIARGHGNYNLDLNDVDQSPWSWHYEKVVNIADFGSTACNGTPEMLEDHLTSWMASNAYACFWSYRLLREINLSE